MKEIRYTLLSDGSSDKALLPILSWLFYEHCPDYAIQAEWADLGRLPRAPDKLSERIKSSIELYPCDVLFVHRDAEKMSWEKRTNEIRQELANINPPAVCVVPVRMMEAWLLFDKMAIRQAAGNPNGSQPLKLPAMNDIERLPNPKQILHNLLRLASGHSGKRRRQRLPISKFAFRVTQMTESFEPLRELAAFKQLEDEFLKTVNDRKWIS